ncbi:MAG: thioredoxin fold domain-containing protein [Gammaproteobacteria bacterium]|nr:thioredoxin fold domain-containing protein [Gammaproteobacteria bacterium]
MDQGTPIINVDLPDFATQVIAASHETPILVDFWADWCAPCLTLAPVLKQVVSDYQGRFRLAKVEVDEGENMKLAGQYQLRGFPTCILFIAGEERARFASHRPSPWIRAFLDEHLAAA